MTATPPDRRPPRAGRLSVGLRWALVLGVVAALAVLIGAPDEPPRPRLLTVATPINAPGGKAITPERCLELPPRYGDFDLRCVVELPADGELDLVFRKVEHWGPRDVQLPLFHPRFAVLRMSTRAEGKGFLTREEALFGKPEGGVLMSPGEPGASLVLECRGRTARAEVNGMVFGPFETADEFGNVALLVRGGTAVVKDFVITPWPAVAPPRPSSRLALEVFLVCALVGGAGGLLGWFGTSPWQLVGAVVIGLLAAWAASSTVFAELLPAVRHTDAALIATALSGLPAALMVAVCWPRRWLRIVATVVIGGLGMAAAVDFALRHEGRRLAPFEDERLDLVFGPESGTAPFDAMTRMLRCEFVAHTLLPPPQRYDVLLLGGKRFFDHHQPGSVENNVGARLPGMLQQRLGLGLDKRVEVAAVPTELSHVYQQFLLFTNYYHEYRPRVVVLGITAEEGESMHHLPARQVVADVEQRAPVALGLFELWRRRSRGVAVLQTPDELALTLAELHTVCRRLESRLVLAVDAGVPAPYRAAVQKFATAQTVPLVAGFDLDAEVYPVAQLADALGRLLIE
jgi:hypothetical protein